MKKCPLPRPHPLKTLIFIKKAASAKAPQRTLISNKLSDIHPERVQKAWKPRNENARARELTVT